MMKYLQILLIYSESLIDILEQFLKKLQGSFRRKLPKRVLMGFLKKYLCAFLKEVMEKLLYKSLEECLKKSSGDFMNELLEQFPKIFIVPLQIFYRNLCKKSFAKFQELRTFDSKKKSLEEFLKESQERFLKRNQGAISEEYHRTLEDFCSNA